MPTSPKKNTEKTTRTLSGAPPKVSASVKRLGGVFQKLRLNLQKRITSNQSASELLDIEFNELINSGISVEVKRFFELYKELFYKIKRSSSPEKQSHHDLIHESLHYINNFIDYCQPELYPSEVNCDTEMALLTEGLLQINDNIFEKETSFDKKFLDLLAKEKQIGNKVRTNNK